MNKNIPTYYYPKVLQKELSHATTETGGDMSKASKVNPKLTMILSLKDEMCGSVEIEYRDPENTVLYDGDPNSPIMVIGEAPGEKEVLQQKPFVGRSGRLLQEMMDHAGIYRTNIYVTNTVIWRPPNNRTPLPEEIAIIRPYLLRHIEIIQPKIIILVGGIAYRCVMGDPPIAITKIRGVWQSREFCNNIINIFHPAYLIRSPIHRRETWRDILNIRKKILELTCGQYLGKGSLSFMQPMSRF